MINKLKDFFLNNRETKQTIAKNIFWLSIGQIGSRFIRAFIIIYAARVLGASGYGVFSYVVALTGFFTVFADIGVNAILTREIARKKEEALPYFATTFWIKIALLFLTTILIIFIAPYFSKIEAAKAILPFAALLIFFDSLRELWAAFFRGKEKMEIEALLITVTNIAITVFGFLILQFSKDPKILTIAYALSASTGAFVGIYILRNELKKVIFYFKKNLVPVIFKSALPLALVNVIGVLMTQIDILMLGFLKQAEDVGLYSAGQKIIALFYILPSILATSFFPLLARYVGQNDNEKAKLLIEKALTLTMLVAIPMVVGGFVLGDQIINFLYGQQYLSASTSFKILLLTILVVFPGTIVANYIFAYDQQKKLATTTLFGSITNVFMNALLIPFFGIIGAAIATVSAQSIYNALNWRLAKKINNFRILYHLKKIILSALIMGIFSYFLKQLNLHLIINILFSTIIYFITLSLLKEKTINEFKELIKINKIKN